MAQKISNSSKKLYAKTRNTRVSRDFNFGQVVRVLIHQGPSYFFKKNKNFKIKKMFFSIAGYCKILPFENRILNLEDILD